MCFFFPNLNLINRFEYIHINRYVHISSDLNNNNSFVACRIKYHEYGEKYITLLYKIYFILTVQVANKNINPLLRIKSEKNTNISLCLNMHAIN